MSKSESELKELLARTKEIKDEEVNTVTFRGLACSRSVNNLHLAIATGVIAIPIANIEDITRLNPLEQTTVAVKVRSACDVKYLKRMPILEESVDPALVAGQNTPLRSLFVGVANTDDIRWPPVYGPGVNTSVCVTTVTDGNACDDSECQNFPDDLGQ